MQQGHWPPAPAHSNALALHPTLGFMPGRTRTVFPGYGSNPCTGAPGVQPKTPPPASTQDSQSHNRPRPPSTATGPASNLLCLLSLRCLCLCRRALLASLLPACIRHISCGEDSPSEEEDRQSRTSSQLSSLRSASLRDMLAAFVTMTTREIHDLQARVQQLEAALNAR